MKEMVSICGIGFFLDQQIHYRSTFEKHVLYLIYDRLRNNKMLKYFSQNQYPFCM